jgi:RNA polymerase sigma-70 factor, ECF subfamily
MNLVSVVRAGKISETPGLPPCPCHIGATLLVHATMTELEQFETFMLNYQNMVFTHAFRLLGNQAEASDVSQTVFLKAYERFAELANSPTVGGWLKRVATNLCLNHLQRYRARWRLFSEMTTGDDDEDHHPDPAAEGPSPGTLGDDEKRLLEEALRRLPDSQRVPLVLHHFEDLSCEQIAAELDVSVGKVKTDMHRGRLALRRKLLRNEAGELSALRTGA